MIITNRADQRGGPAGTRESQRGQGGPRQCHVTPKGPRGAPHQTHTPQSAARPDVKRLKNFSDFFFSASKFLARRPGFCAPAEQQQLVSSRSLALKHTATKSTDRAQAPICALCLRRFANKLLKARVYLPTLSSGVHMIPDSHDSRVTPARKGKSFQAVVTISE